MFKKKEKKEKIKKEKDTRPFVDKVDDQEKKISKMEEVTGKKFRYKTDRVTAYLIDLLIVIFLVTLLTSNTITNPYYGTTKDIYNEYKETYETESDKITKDNQVTAKEMETLLKKTSKSYRIYYIRSNFPTYFWYIVMTIFYFGFFAYSNNGQTLGKKFYRFKVVDYKTGRKPKLWQMLVRNLFGGSMLLCGTNLVVIFNMIIMVLCKPAVPFVYIINISNGFGYLLDLIFILMYFFKKNSRTLDDLVGRTKVVSVPKKNVLNED